MHLVMIQQKKQLEPSSISECHDLQLAKIGKFFFVFDVIACAMWSAICRVPLISADHDLHLAEVGKFFSPAWHDLQFF